MGVLWPVEHGELQIELRAPGQFAPTPLVNGFDTTCSSGDYITTHNTRSPHTYIMPLAQVKSLSIDWFLFLNSQVKGPTDFTDPYITHTVLFSQTQFTLNQPRTDTRGVQRVKRESSEFTHQFGKASERPSCYPSRSRIYDTALNTSPRLRRSVGGTGLTWRVSAWSNGVNN